MRDVRTVSVMGPDGVITEEGVWGVWDHVGGNRENVGGNRENVGGTRGNAADSISLVPVAMVLLQFELSRDSLERIVRHNAVLEDSRLLPMVTAQQSFDVTIAARIVSAGVTSPWWRSIAGRMAGGTALERAGAAALIALHPGRHGHDDPGFDLAGDIEALCALEAQCPGLTVRLARDWTGTLSDLIDASHMIAA